MVRRLSGVTGTEQRLIGGLGLAILLALPVSSVAQTRVPAPDYFVTTVMETTTAQMLAVNCATLSIHLGKAAQRSEMVLGRLAEDGFDPATLEARMEDPSQEIAVLQAAFTEKHGLVGTVSEAQICAAGQAEIVQGTGIGTLLLGVPE